MREEEIKTELGLGVRCFLEVKERSKRVTIDHFEELQLLESSFSRLFLCVEHVSNALLVFETGNFSKKHFGDFAKLENIKQKYSLDLQKLYHKTYSFRAYADYRKFPEIEKDFNRETLKQELKTVETTISTVINIIKQKINLEQLELKIKEQK
ncbi:hypothetical protein HYY69_01885 [Candidatus Woesearchaeota archaeon]|nr:hypothetical protein [Candidatus Woesearchaeota archaeon]